MNSLGNLVLVVFVARASGSAEFGAWSLVYALYSASLILSRTVASTPMMIAEEASPDALKADERGSVGAAAMIGIVIGAGLLGAAALTHGALSRAFLVFGVAMPFLLLQDALRYVSFHVRREARAASMDALWIVLQLVGFALLLALGSDRDIRPLLFTCVWAIGALGSSLLGLRLWGRRLDVGAVAEFAVRHRGASGRLGVEAGLNAAQGAALPFMLAWTAGLGAAGAFRAGTTLMGGVALLVMALTPLTTVEVVRRVRAKTPVLPLVRLWTVAIAAAAVLYGLLLVSLPDAAGRELMGDSWAGGRSVLLPLLLQAAVRGPFTGVPILLRAQRRLNEAVRLRVRTTVINTALPLLGGAVGGLTGAAWAIVLAAIINDVQSVVAYRRTPSIIAPNAR